MVSGILLNETALAALVSCDVSYADGRQHASVIATFCWPRVFQQGEVLLKTAALYLDQLPRCDGAFDHSRIEQCAIVCTTILDPIATD